MFWSNKRSILDWLVVWLGNVIIIHRNRSKRKGVSKHAGSNSEAFWSWPVIQHGAKIRPDCICRIQLPASDSVLFFQTRPRSQLQCKTDLDPILMAWSRFGQTHLVQKQVSVQESLGPVLAECKWPTTSFPFSDSVVFFHRWPRSYCAKPAQT